MFTRFGHDRLLRYAGLFTWAVVSVPLLYSWLVPLFGDGADDQLALRPMPWPGWVSYFAFGLSYAWLTRGLVVCARTLRNFALLVVFAVGAVGVSYYNETGVGIVLLIVAACVLPW